MAPSAVTTQIAGPRFSTWRAGWLLALLPVALSPAQAATWYVDYTAGSDAGSGLTAASAFRHCPGDPAATAAAASAVLSPGDRVLFRGGVVYRGSVEVPASGSPGNPVVFDGNSGGVFGSGPAVIDGSEVLADWTPCASATDCPDNPNWASLYVVEAPADVTAWNANLYQGERDLAMAQEPDLSDPFYLDRYDEYRSAPPANVTTTSLVDPAYFTQTAATAWNGATIAVWATPNYVYFQPVTGFEPAARRIRFEALPSEPYGDRDTRYSMLNHLRLLDRPGEFAVQSSAAGTRIVLWPRDGVDPDLAGVTVSRRQTAFDLAGKSHITIRGFVIQKFLSTPPRRGAGVSNDGSPAQGITVIDNHIRWCNKDSTWKHSAIHLSGVDGALVAGNEIYENRRIGGYLGDASHSTIRQNHVRRCGYVGIWLMGARSTAIIGNTVEDNLGTHSNGISVYLNSEDVLVFGNRVFDSNIAFTSQQSSSVQVAYNVFVNPDFYALADWGDCAGLAIYNNVVIRGDDRFALTVASPGAGLHNNVITYSDGSLAPDANHNIVARLADLTSLFVAPALNDYRLRPDSPAVDAGLDLGFDTDLAGTPVPLGLAPDIGAYELDPRDLVFADGFETGDTAAWSSSVR